MIKNLVFAGTPQIAADLLIDLINHNYKISACLTRPDKPQGRNQRLTVPPVKTVAIKHCIPCLQPSKIRDPITINYLKELKPDLMIVFAYGFILPQEILNIPQFGCFNIHTSLLPKFRGAAPVQNAILLGEEMTGISIIKMTLELDSGAICYQATCSITPTETSESLYKKLQPLATASILKVLYKLNQGSLAFTEQDHTKATYAHKINKSDAKVDWLQKAIDIDRKIRAFIPSPVAFTQMETIPIRIWHAEILPTEAPCTTKVGSILSFNRQGIDVATGKGVLRLLKIQFPGGKILTSIDLFNSSKYRLFFQQHQIFN